MAPCDVEARDVDVPQNSIGFVGFLVWLFLPVTSLKTEGKIIPKWYTTRVPVSIMGSKTDEKQMAPNAALQNSLSRSLRLGGYQQQHACLVALWKVT